MFALVSVIRNQLTQGVEVFVAGQIVADDVMGLPASKQGEARPDLHLHWVIQNLQMGGGDVANLISVVDILSRSRKDSLKEKTYRVITITLSVKISQTIVVCV